MKTRYLGFKASPAERRRVEQLAKQTGTNMSEVLRALVVNAEIKPVTTMQPVGAINLDSIKQ